MYLKIWSIECHSSSGFSSYKKCTNYFGWHFFSNLPHLDRHLPHAVQPGRHFGSLPCWNGIPGIGAWMPPALRWLLPWWFPSWAFWQDLAWWPLASQLKSGAVDRSSVRSEGSSQWFFRIVKNYDVLHRVFIGWVVPLPSNKVTTRIFFSTGSL